jgi:hypothetical protein
MTNRLANSVAARQSAIPKHHSTSDFTPKALTLDTFKTPKRAFEGFEGV